MDPLRMVPLLTASSPMEAKLLAARLGAEGIVWELRGSVDGPFAIGPIDVLVDAAAVEDARQLLLIDEVESSFASSAGDAGAARDRPSTLRDLALGLLVVVLVVLFALARMGARV